MMVAVVCFGEMLIDFIPTISGVSLIDAPAFKKTPGGAPANVAVGLSRLGISSGFMGKVGDDPFGHYLVNTLVANNVDTLSVRYSCEARTALAFISLTENGERDFSFYRNPSADMLFSSNEVDESTIKLGKMFHFGSISLIVDPCRTATIYALKIAKKNGLTISYDPNLRLNLWPDAKTAKEGIMYGWQFANVIKVSEEELYFLSHEDDLIKGVMNLWHTDLKVVLITRGALGCTYITPDYYGEVSGYKVKVVDTTGAGDGFMAGLLKGILKVPDALRNQNELESICRYANAAGALTTTRRGAIPGLPTQDQINELLKSNGY